MTHLTRALAPHPARRPGGRAGRRRHRARRNRRLRRSPLLSYMGAVFRAFEFWPAREALAPEPERAACRWRRARPGAIIRHAIGVYATRIARTRAATLAPSRRRFGGRGLVVAARPSSLLPDGPGRAAPRDDRVRARSRGPPPQTTRPASRCRRRSRSTRRSRPTAPVCRRCSRLAHADSRPRSAGCAGRWAWIAWRWPKPSARPATLATAMQMVVHRTWRLKDRLHDRRPAVACAMASRGSNGRASTSTRSPHLLGRDGRRRIPHRPLDVPVAGQPRDAVAVPGRPARRIATSAPRERRTFRVILKSRSKRPCPSLGGAHEAFRSRWLVDSRPRALVRGLSGPGRFIRYANQGSGGAGNTVGAGGDAGLGGQAGTLPTGTAGSGGSNPLGVAGTTGRGGTTGMAGTTGTAGTTGRGGTTGTAGTTGMAGTTGRGRTTGMAGTTGTAGTTGRGGTTGTAGTTGMAGTTGRPERRGRRGRRGPGSGRRGRRARRGSAGTTGTGPGRRARRAPQARRGGRPARWRDGRQLRRRPSS